MCFPVFCVCFFCLKSNHICFYIWKSFCKSCISPEYYNCDNSHFSPSNLVLQLLRATRWCRNIFLILSKKKPPQSEVWKMMDAQVMFWMRLSSNKQLSTKIVSERRITKMCCGRCHSNCWWNWLHISSIPIGLHYIVCILSFNLADLRMDGSGSGWMTLSKVLPHRYK